MTLTLPLILTLTSIQTITCIIFLFHGQAYCDTLTATMIDWNGLSFNVQLVLNIFKIPSFNCFWFGIQTDEPRDRRTRETGAPAAVVVWCRDHEDSPQWWQFYLAGRSRCRRHGRPKGSNIFPKKKKTLYRGIAAAVSLQRNVCNFSPSCSSFLYAWIRAVFIVFERIYTQRTEKGDQGQEKTVFAESFNRLHDIIGGTNQTDWGRIPFLQDYLFFFLKMQLFFF